MNKQDHQPSDSPAATQLDAAPAKPPVRWWARLVTFALAAATVWWLCFKN